MAEEARKLLVVTGPAGRTFAVSELPDSGRFVADDLAEGRRLGDLNGDLMPFVVTIDDAPFIVFAGTVLSPGGADRVELTSPGLTGIHQTCRVRNRAWMSFPEPFTEEMVITAAWRADDHVLFERQSEPLRSDALEPVFGPGWTPYAPLE
jgi:hypothetical protein